MPYTPGVKHEAAVLRFSSQGKERTFGGLRSSHWRRCPVRFVVRRAERVVEKVCLLAPCRAGLEILVSMKH